MAQLQKYRGTNSLPGVRQPQVIADDAVGRAVQGLGSQIQQSAGQFGQLAQLAQTRQNEVEDFQRKKGILDFGANFSTRELEASTDLAPGASGYTEKMLSEFDKDADTFVQSLPESTRAQATLDVKGLRSQYVTRFAKTELSERNRFYKQGIAEGTDVLAKSINANPEAFEDARARGRELISESGLPRIEKENALKSWDRMASLAWVETLPAEKRAKMFKPADVNANSLIKSKEGLRTDAYWDVNAYRTGYGSDTVTRADGRVERVTKDTVITRADAERDLSRRIGEFQKVAIKAVGVDAWAGLPDRVRASLTSITYNYGELPGSVARAVKSGDMEAVAASVEGLKGHNGGINAKRRQNEADIIRGVASIPNASPEEQDRLDSLTYEDTLKLSDQAQRDMITISGDRKEAFSLEIAKDPLTVDRTSILDDPVLDDGQKAALLNSLSAALKGGQDDRLAIAWAQGAAKGNPFAPDDRKAAGLVYDQITASGGDPDQVAGSIVERKGVVPKPYADEVRNGLRSNSAEAVQRSFERSSMLLAMDPDAVRGAEHGDEIENAALRWRVYREGMGLSSEEAARRIAANNTPEGMARREALLKSEPVVKALKEITADKVEQYFDEGIFSIGPALGASDAGKAVAVDEFKGFFREAIGETNGDVEAAEKIAYASLSRLWATSEFSPMGDNVVLKYVPERIYPAIGGGHGYLRKQAEEVLKAEGKSADRLFLVGNPEYTVQDYRAGRAPRLTVQYVDENGVMQQLPFAFQADVDVARAEQEAAKAKDWELNGARYEEEQRAAEERRALGDASRPSEMGGSPLDQMNNAAEEFNQLEAQ